MPDPLEIYLVVSILVLSSRHEHFTFYLNSIPSGVSFKIRLSVIIQSFETGNFIIAQKSLEYPFEMEFCHELLDHLFASGTTTNYLQYVISRELIVICQNVCHGLASIRVLWYIAKKR